MMQRIGIIGHFGGDLDFLDGQTIKTKTLYEELKNQNFDLFCVDTYYNKSDKIRLMFDSIKCALTCKVIIILLSGNGLKVYLPMMYCIKKLLHRRVYHDVIGGNLAKYIDQYPKYKKYLNSFDGNWVEFEGLKNELKVRGISNCIVIPNFRYLNTEKVHPEIDDESTHKLCIFSRVMKEKGVTDAVLAVHKHNLSHDFKFILDIWGPIDEQYKNDFEKLMTAYQKDAKYMGTIGYNKSVDVLTDHLALLFPTYWEGEGFPGTIVDAFGSGLPVIATDWNANSELIDNNFTGIVYSKEKDDALVQCLDWASNNIMSLKRMRVNCLNEYAKYSPEFIIPKIITLIEKEVD